jgi:DNA-binding PadR family transcriptional regulator
METRAPASPDAFLPLKPADFHILVALLGGERHGYGIMQQVSADSEGRVSLELGSLYRLIARLHDVGLIAESNRRPAPDDDPRRRYYRITTLGRLVAQHEARRLAAVVRLARAHDLLGGLA